MKAHWLEAPQGDIDTDTLQAEGILYQKLDTDEARFQSSLDALKERQGYVAQDEVALRPDNPKLDEICAKFVDEHYHDEDEVRFILDGAGIFDIRTRDDRWMRVEVETGDLIVVPAGRHHRFFLTDERNIRAVRLFKDPSGWVPRYRQAAE
ncbi:MAG: cupin domain-containing protein [Haliangiales bacterium]